jgi:3-methyladenine DNA glycosylase AlkD
MDNNIDFDVDNLDKEFKENKLNNRDIDHFWYKKINKQIDYPRLAIITFCLIVISIMVYVNRRDSILREFEIKNDNFVSSDLYKCDSSVQEKANQLRPVSSLELDNRTEQLNSWGKDLSYEKINLEKIKAELVINPNSLKLEEYKRDVQLYNDKMANYQSEFSVHKKEIDEYNNKVKLYYDYLKANCVPN